MLFRSDPVSDPELAVTSISTTDGETLAAIPAIESGARSIEFEVETIFALPDAVRPIVAPIAPETNETKTVSNIKKLFGFRFC